LGDSRVEGIVALFLNAEDDHPRKKETKMTFQWERVWRRTGWKLLWISAEV
jgi:hypothetical protein